MKNLACKLVRIVLLIWFITVTFGCPHQPGAGDNFNSESVHTEKIDRGLVALVRGDTSVYLGWRLLAGDPEDVAFNVYRKMIGAVLPNEYVKINSEPIVGSTNYVDKGSDYDWLNGTTAKVHEAHRYKITRIVNGKEEDVPGGET